AGSSCEGATRPTNAPSDVICRRSRLNQAGGSLCAAADRGAATNGATARTVAQSARRARLFRRSDRGSRVVGLKNRFEVLAGAGAADRAPLAHPDAVPIAVAAQREAVDQPVGALRRFDGKIGAVEDL